MEGWELKNLCRSENESHGSPRNVRGDCGSLSEVHGVPQKVGKSQETCGSATRVHYWSEEGWRQFNDMLVIKDSLTT